MNHRIVSGVITGLLLLLVSAALLFALGVVPLRASGNQVSARPASVPQEQGGAYVSCRDCHRPEGGAPVMPVTHRRFRLTTCATCHAAAQRGS